MAEAEGEKKEVEVKELSGAQKKKRKGIISRIWNSIFGLHRSGDFEKRLQYITKEEANVLKRMNKRSLTWRARTRQLIFVSVVLEVVAVVYAIMTTRSMDLDWKMRAIRVLPMFVLPAFSAAVYSVFVSVTKMRDRKDQKTLERLRAERQEKIDELKERTNYYITQQLIQRYDPDPAAKAAAATVLASKLGADSGLKVYVGDENAYDVTTGKTKDLEHVQASGLRNRKQGHSKSSSGGSTPVPHSDREMTYSVQSEDPIHEHQQLVVEHYHPETSTANDGGWLARLAALLVGEDPTQSYALICGNCHRHNGLARKEDFPYVTYYCPHCMALNQPKQVAEGVSGLDSPHLSTLGSGDIAEAINKASGPPGDGIPTSDSPVKAGSEVEETAEAVAMADSKS